MTSPSPTTAGHRPLRTDIEGLRAIAVLTVLLYHLHVPWVPGGFAGVDVFFVISGFLITSLLLREVARTGTVALADFYARRARRLLPAASVVLVFTLVVGWLVLPVSGRPTLLSDVAGATLYVINWVLSARSVDYLAEDADVSPLQHYWSLSVEEQFYIVWPLLILLALLLARRFRLRPRRLMFLLLAVLGISSLAWSVYATATMPATAYFVTTTRLWELAAGALLAFATPRLQHLPRWASQVGVAAGLVLIALGMTLVDATTPWPGSAALVPVVGTALVIAAGTPGHRTVGGQLLGLAPMVWIGGLSYAIYLWHWPIIVLAEARWGELSVPVLAGLGVAAVVLSWLTKHLVEDPIRYHRGLAGSPWRSLVAGGTTMAVICGAVLVGWVTRPSLDGDGPAAPGPATLVADAGASSWEVVADPVALYPGSGPVDPDPAVAPQDVPSYYADGCQIRAGDPEPRECVYGDPDSGTEVVLWGDSKLGQYFTAFEHIARKEGWRLTLQLKSACAPTVSGASEAECNEFGQTVLEQMTSGEDRPDTVVMSMGGYSNEEVVAGVLEAATALQDAGVPVVILQDNYPPTVPEGQRWETSYDCAAENADDLRVCDFEPTGPVSEEGLLHVAETLELPTINLRPWICPEGGPCPVVIGGQLIYRQGSHITDTYARSLTPFLHRGLVEAGVSQASPDSIRLDDIPPRAED